MSHSLLSVFSVKLYYRSGFVRLITDNVGRPLVITPIRPFQLIIRCFLTATTYLSHTRCIGSPGRGLLLLIRPDQLIIRYFLMATSYLSHTRVSEVLVVVFYF